MPYKTKILLFVLLVFSFSFSVAAQNETLTNKEIVALTKAGLGKSLIIQKIEDSKSNFNLSTDELIELKKAGVEEDVISAMFKAKKSSNVSLPVSDDSKSKSESASTDTETNNSDDPVCINATLNKKGTDNFTRNICSLANNIVNGDEGQILEPDDSARQLLELFVGEVAKRNKLFTNAAEEKAAAEDFFLTADKKRTDKQIGSSPNSAGTTSLAVKGGAPSIIGWAVENGAATSSITGNTVTVRVNPYGLLRAIGGRGFLGEGFLTNLKNPKSEETKTQDFLRKFSTSFSFDTIRGNENPTFIVSQQQLSAFSVRYEFINQRTPYSQTAQKKFREFVSQNSKTFNQYDQLIDKLVDQNNGTFKNSALQGWLDETNRKIKAIPNPSKEKVKLIQNQLKPGDENLAEVLKLVDAESTRKYKEAVRLVIQEQLNSFPVDQLLEDPVVKTAFEDFANLTVSYEKQRQNFIKEVNKGTVAAFEYTNNREPVAPDTSNFRFIYENGRFFNNTDFTFNASLTMYNKKPMFTGVKRVRDFQFALQTDTTLENFGDTVVTFAGRYERLNTDVVDPLGVVMPNSKGDVAVGQFKFTIPIADWGIKLPLSLTFANRTDLIKESTVRANFGFTFDLDPIFAKFKPF